MSTGDQGRGYDGPWFPPLTAAPVPSPPSQPPTPAEPTVTVEARTPAWLTETAEPPLDTAPEAQRARRRWVMPGAVTLLVLAGVLGAGAVALASGEPGDTATETLAEPSLGTLQDMTPDDWCPAIHTADRVQGSSKGDLRTGPGLILWVMHSWFVERDPAAVRSAFAPGASVASPESTRTAVESVVPGTKHCVNVVVLADNLFRVRVEQFKPDGSVHTTSDDVVIANIGGRPLITAIRPGDGNS